LLGVPGGRSGAGEILIDRRQLELPAEEIIDASHLIRDKQLDLAAQVRRFALEMPQPLTEKELIAAELTDRVKSVRETLNR
jgi:hypothetical protein